MSKYAYENRPLPIGYGLPISKKKVPGDANAITLLVHYKIYT